MRPSVKLKTIFFSISVPVLISISGCGYQPEKVSRPLLGTIVTITVVDKPENLPGDFDAAFKEIEDVQKNFNPYSPESEISLINRKACGTPVKTGDELFSLIRRSLEISEKTSGAFDITFASMGKVWDFSSHSENRFTPPDDKIIRKLQPLISYKNVRLDSGSRTVEFLKSTTKIGLGAIAKGYAAGRAAAALKKRDVKGAIVACAGDIQVIGSNNGKPWRTGIQDPRGNSIIAELDLENGDAISTSGDYERFRMYKGRRYHHIIDPATGYPSNSGLISVSILSTDPVLSDGYDTAFLIMGFEETVKILKSMSNLSAVIVTADMRIFASKSLKGRITFRNGLIVSWF